MNKAELIQAIKTEVFPYARPRGYLASLSKDYLQKMYDGAVRLKLVYTNICPHCGAENSIFPVFRGRKKIYVCNEDAGGCGKATKGISRAEYRKTGDEQ